METNAYMFYCFFLLFREKTTLLSSFGNPLSFSDNFSDNLCVLHFAYGKLCDILCRIYLAKNQNL